MPPPIMRTRIFSLPPAAEDTNTITATIRITIITIVETIPKTNAHNVTI